MRIFTMPQYSPEWYEARRGKVTASRMEKVVTPKTGELSKQSDDYLCELVADVLTGRKLDRDGYVSPAMEAGTAMEPEARNFYAFDRDVDVLEVGGCLSDDGRYWCSPDLLVGEIGGAEIKCPQEHTQVRRLLDGVLPDAYKVQIHGSLLITGREWWDFVSYCPSLPTFSVRVYPDDFTKRLASVLAHFWAKYERALEIIGQKAA